MTTVDVLKLLKNDDVKLVKGLRAASILPEVAANIDLATWFNLELTGYSGTTEVEPPIYRRWHFKVMGNANNGVHQHRNVEIPIHTFSEIVQNHSTKYSILRDSIGSMETILDVPPPNNPGLTWPALLVGQINREIAEGSTGVDDTYRFTEVWFAIPPGAIHETLGQVRQRALQEISKFVSPNELANLTDTELHSVGSKLTVHGSGNQIILDSPGAMASFTITSGDRTALSDALSSLGITQDSIYKLNEILDDESAEKSGKLMRALEWSRVAAIQFGIDTVAGGVATLILQYFGLI